MLRFLTTQRWSCFAQGRNISRAGRLLLIVGTFMNPRMRHCRFQARPTVLIRSGDQFDSAAGEKIFDIHQNTGVGETFYSLLNST